MMLCSGIKDNGVSLGMVTWDYIIESSSIDALGISTFPKTPGFGVRENMLHIAKT